MVHAATGYAMDSLSCKAADQFEIKSIQDKIVEVDDADGFTHKLHHSHFKAVAT